jgi:hypothetical protein
VPEHAKPSFNRCQPLLPLVYLVYICNQVILFNLRKATPMSEKEAQPHPVIAVRVKPDLYAWADGQAAIEGISRSGKSGKPH